MSARDQPLSIEAKAFFAKKIEAWLADQESLAADPEVTSQYVMVMLDNMKDRVEIAAEMDMFLGASAEVFATWLWSELDKYFGRMPPKDEMASLLEEDGEVYGDEEEATQHGGDDNGSAAAPKATSSSGGRGGGGRGVYQPPGRRTGDGWDGQKDKEAASGDGWGSRTGGAQSTDRRRVEAPGASRMFGAAMKLQRGGAADLRKTITKSRVSGAKMGDGAAGQEDQHGGDAASASSGSRVSISTHGRKMRVRMNTGNSGGGGNNKKRQRQGGDGSVHADGDSAAQGRKAHYQPPNKRGRGGGSDGKFAVV